MIIFVWLHIIKTEIHVYEQGIKGKSMDANFIIDFLKLFNFRSDKDSIKMSEFHLGYDQISSVECKGKSVILKTESKNHKCYAMNVNEIQEAIMKQKNISN